MLRTSTDIDHHAHIGSCKVGTQKRCKAENQVLWLTDSLLAVDGCTPIMRTFSWQMYVNSIIVEHCNIKKWHLVIPDDASRTQNSPCPPSLNCPFLAPFVAFYARSDSKVALSYMQNRIQPCPSYLSQLDVRILESSLRGRFVGASLSFVRRLDR